MPNLEFHEPPDLALRSLARSLVEVTMSDSTAWLIAFLDLLDKAAQCEPDERLLAVVRAALASAPSREAWSVGNECAASLERGYRRVLRAGDAFPPAARAEREVLIVVPKRAERIALTRVFTLADMEPKAFDSHIRYRRFQMAPDPTADDEGSQPSTYVTLVCIQEAGNLAAARVVRDYVSTFGRPDLAILCGMAMGISNDVSTGDVVIASQLSDRTVRRLTPLGDRSRAVEYPPPPELLHDLRDHVDAREDVMKARFEQVS